MNRIYDLIGSGTQWCIAGGYAACPALATDMDVWIYQVKDDLETVRRQLIVNIERLTTTLNETRPIWPEKRFLWTSSAETQLAPAYQGINVQILKVGDFIEPHSHRSKPIHLMVTDATSPGEILEGFDISTHAVAIDQSGRIWKHSGWTAPHQPPAVLFVAKNGKTPERYDRICRRFGHVPQMHVQNHIREVMNGNHE